MKIRIAYLIDEIESPSAGTEKQLVHLIERLDRTQFEPVLVVLRSTPWLETYSGCQVHCLGIDTFKRPSAWRSLWRFAKYLKQEGVHCIQTHFRDAFIAGVVAAKMAGNIRVIQTRKNQGYWMSRSDCLIFRLLNHGVRAFVSNSEDTRHWMTRNELVAPERINVIHNGLDFSDFSRRDNGTRWRMRRALGLGDLGVGIVLVANLRPVKRADLFLDAAARVVGEYPGALFFLVGQGSCREALKAQAAALGVSGKVRFLGRRHDIPDILAAMDIGVLTSDSESFSNSVLEYLAAGLSVVCTDVGGCREAFGDDVCGALVPPGDAAAIAEAIQGFCRDREKRKLNRIAAPEVIQSRFSLERYVGSYESLYREIVYAGGGM